MKNKGFSMVELIIVIAIMAILAGFLAPALIKYINKARLSADLTTGREIAVAIMATVVDEDHRDDAATVKGTPKKVTDMQNAAFKAAVFEYLGLASDYNLLGKSKKDIDGGAIDQNYYYLLDSTKNKVEIFYGNTGSDYQVYPITGKKLLK